MLECGLLTVLLILSTCNLRYVVILPLPSSCDQSHFTNEGYAKFPRPDSVTVARCMLRSYYRLNS